MNVKKEVVPITVDIPGATPQYLEKHLDTIGMNRISTHQLQNVALLGTACILQWHF